MTVVIFMSSLRVGLMKHKRTPRLFVLVAIAALCAGCARETPVARPTLQQQIDEFHNEWLRTAPSNIVASFEAGLQKMREAGITNNSVNVGDTAPDFSLPDTDGNTVRLSELLKKGPVILTWHRGGWCPYCNIHLRVLEERLTDIVQLGGRLVAIVPEVPSHAQETKESKKLSFVVLSDTGNKVAGQYGIVYRVPDEILIPMQKMKGMDFKARFGDDSYTLPLAATYIIDTKGIVRFAFLDPDYRKRAEPADLIEALKYIDWN